jgi:hypothetical protein
MDCWGAKRSGIRRAARMEGGIRRLEIMETQNLLPETSVLSLGVLKELCRRLDERPAIFNAVEYHPRSENMLRLLREIVPSPFDGKGFVGGIHLIENREVPLDEIWYIYPMQGRLDFPFTVRQPEVVTVDMGPLKEDYVYAPKPVRVVRHRIVEGRVVAFAA